MKKQIQKFLKNFSFRDFVEFCFYNLTKTKKCRRFLCALLLLSFFIFLASQPLSYFQKNFETFKILEIKSADTFCLDFNKNGKVDKAECVRLAGIVGAENDVGESSTTFISKGFTLEEQISNFQVAKIKLYQLFGGKDVKVKLYVADDKKYAQIFYDDVDIATIILKKGLALVNEDNFLGQFYAKYENPINLQKENGFKKNVKDKDYIILNNKNLIYHEKDCPYGYVASDYKIIKREELLEAHLPCKVCHKSLHKKQKKEQTKITWENGSVDFYILDTIGVHRPNNNCETRACQALLNVIKNAQRTLDIAVYSISGQPLLIKELENAKKRGVVIRLIVDGKNLKKNNKDIKALIRLFPNTRGSRSSEYERGIMHNKFVIADGKTVYTGSANFTATGLSGFNSNLVLVFNSEKIADIYTQEFEQMYNLKFSVKKEKILNKNFKFNGDDISFCFSPKDSCVEKLVLPVIKGAKKEILMPMYTFTHKEIENELEKAAARGVDVKIIIDAAGAEAIGSRHHNLRRKGVAVKTENFAGKMHTKALFIDKEISIIGSMNYTASGDRFNDENIVLIKNEKLAQKGKDYFLKNWSAIPDKWLTKDPQAESDDSPFSCSDGIDNDYDGLIDASDSGCPVE